MRYILIVTISMLFLPCLAQTHHDVGVFEKYVAEGRLSDAKALSGQLLKDTSDLDTMNKVKLFLSLGILYEVKNLAKLQMGEDYLLTALSLASTINNDSVLVRTYNLLAVNYLYQSELQKATEYFEKSVAVNLTKGNLELLVVPYINLANIYHRQGIYAESINYLSEALSILRNSEQPNLRYLAAALNNKANSHKQLAEYDWAYSLNKEALEIKKELYPPKHPSVINTHISLAEILIDDEKPQKAMDVLDYLKGLNLSNKDQLGDLQSFYGEAYAALGQFGQAVDSHKESIKYYQEVYDSKHDWIGGSFGNIGDAYAEMGVFDSANFYYQKALQAISYDYDFETLLERPVYQKLSNVGGAINMLFRKAKAIEKWYEKNDDIEFQEAAYLTYSTAIDFIEKEWQNYQRDDLLLFYGDKMTELYKATINCAYKLSYITGSPKYLEEAFIYSEKRRNWLLLKSMNQSEALSSGLLPQKVLKAEKSYLNRISQIENQIHKLRKIDNKNAALDSLASLLFGEIRQFENFQDSLQILYTKYFDVKYKNSFASLDQIQQRLLKGNDDVLVSYEFINDSLIYAFRLNKVALEVIEIRAANISSNIRDLITIIRNKKVTEKMSAQLYELLIKPLSLDRGGSLLIIPDGLLSYIPFEVLGKDRHLLIHDHSIRYGYSANLLMRYANQKKKLAQKILSIAPKQTFGLKYAQPEALLAAEVIGGDFKDGLYINELSGIESDEYTMYHFATHGVIDDEDPANSYLQIGPGTLEKSRLYVHQIYNLDLDAELVTLSTCNSAIGKLNRGEGLMSIAHAFAYAGAPNIIATLWAVEDKSTYRIITSFYNYLEAGDPKNEALRKAKLDYLEKTDDYGSHPFYWAGIVLIGDDEAIGASGLSKYFWFGLSLLLLIGSAALFRSYFSK